MLPFIIAGVLIGAALLVAIGFFLQERICHWWDCGEIRRKWKKDEPNRQDYELDVHKPEGEYDRYLTDMDDWRIQGECDADEKAKSPDC